MVIRVIGPTCVLSFPVQLSNDSEKDLIDTKAIRGNAKSRVFHVSECEYYRSKNCSIEFKNIQIALDAGFEPCRFCKDHMDLPQS